MPVGGVTAFGDPKQEAQWDRGGEGIQFFGAKSRRGVQNQELGPWGREWLRFLVKNRALKGFHPDKGAWHGSGEALGKTLVSLLERGGGKKTIRWHAFRRLGAAQLKHMGAPMPTIMLWGGWKTPGVAKMYTEAPPRWKFVRLGEILWPAWVAQARGTQGTGSRKAPPSPSGPPRSGQRSHTPTAKVDDILGEGMRQPRVQTGKGAVPPPPLPEGRGGGVLRSLA